MSNFCSDQGFGNKTFTCRRKCSYYWLNGVSFGLDRKWNQTKFGESGATTFGDRGSGCHQSFAPASDRAWTPIHSSSPATQRSMPAWTLPPFSFGLHEHFMCRGSVRTAGSTLDKGQNRKWSDVNISYWSESQHTHYNALMSLKSARTNSCRKTITLLWTFHI